MEIFWLCSILSGAAGGSSKDEASNSEKRRGRAGAGGMHSVDSGKGCSSGIQDAEESESGVMYSVNEDKDCGPGRQAAGAARKETSPRTSGGQAALRTH